LPSISWQRFPILMQWYDCIRKMQNLNQWWIILKQPFNFITADHAGRAENYLVFFEKADV
jgi:hypothetical protein